MEGFRKSNHLQGERAIETETERERDVVNIETPLYYITAKVHIKTSLISETTLYTRTQDRLQPRLNQCTKVFERQREWIENCWGVGSSFVLVSHIKPKAVYEKSIWKFIGR